MNTTHTLSSDACHPDVDQFSTVASRAIADEFEAMWAEWTSTCAPGVSAFPVRDEEAPRYIAPLDTLLPYTPGQPKDQWPSYLPILSVEECVRIKNSLPVTEDLPHSCYANRSTPGLKLDATDVNLVSLACLDEFGDALIQQELKTKPTTDLAAAVDAISADLRVNATTFSREELDFMPLPMEPPIFSSRDKPCGPSAPKESSPMCQPSLDVPFVDFIPSTPPSPPFAAQSVLGQGTTDSQNLSAPYSLPAASRPKSVRRPRKASAQRALVSGATDLNLAAPSENSLQYTSSQPGYLRKSVTSPSIKQAMFSPRQSSQIRIRSSRIGGHPTLAPAQPGHQVTGGTSVTPQDLQSSISPPLSPPFLASYFAPTSRVSPPAQGMYSPQQPPMGGVSVSHPGTYTHQPVQNQVVAWWDTAPKGLVDQPYQTVLPQNATPSPDRTSVSPVRRPPTYPPGTPLFPCVWKDKDTDQICKTHLPSDYQPIKTHMEEVHPEGTIRVVIPEQGNRKAIRCRWKGCSSVLTNTAGLVKHVVSYHTQRLI